MEHNKIVKEIMCKIAPIINNALNEDVEDNASDEKMVEHCANTIKEYLATKLDGQMKGNIKYIDKWTSNKRGDRIFTFESNNLANDIDVLSLGWKKFIIQGEITLAPRGDFFGRVCYFYKAHTGSSNGVEIAIARYDVYEDDYSIEYSMKKY